MEKERKKDRKKENLPKNNQKIKEDKKSWNKRERR